jgi:uncharacterized RDD family membrane protein YckC
MIVDSRTQEEAAMQWADEVRIETPEQIEVSLEVAGAGSRFVAQLIDWLIKWGIVLVAALLVVSAAALLGVMLLDETMPLLLAALLLALFYAFLLGFDIYFEVRHNGQTPGKKFAGIRAIREGGAPLDFRSACVRNLLGMADFLPVCYLLGGLLVMVSRRGQRLGDMAAGTVVIRERAVQPPADLERTIEPLVSAEFAFTADRLGACSPDDRYILRSFFQRCDEMAPGPREQLALRLADTFLHKLAYQAAAPIEDGYRAEVFLASLYRQLENWAKHDR